MKVTHKQSKREMQPSIHLHIYKIPMWPLLNRLSHLPCPSFNIQFSLLYLLCLHSSPQPKLQYTIFTFIFICFTFTFYTPLFFNIIPMCLLFSWTCSPISPAQAPIYHFHIFFYFFLHSHFALLYFLHNSNMSFVQLNMLSHLSSPSSNFFHQKLPSRFLYYLHIYMIPMCLLFSWTCSPISPAHAPTASPFIPCFFPQAPPRRENVISSFLS